MKKPKLFDDWNENEKLAQRDGIQRGIKQERERIFKKWFDLMKDKRYMNEELIWVFNDWVETEIENG